MEPDHKELLIGLLGSTYGEIKRLDDSIVGSSSTLTRRSDVVKEDLTKLVKGIAQRPDVPILQMVQPPQAVSVQPVISEMSQPIIPPQPPDGAVNLPHVIKDDTNQLEFDLNKVAKYDDVIAEIDRLDRKLNRIEDKLDQIIKNLETPKKKARGLTDSSTYNQ